MSFGYGWRGPNIVKDGLVFYIDPGSPNSYNRFLNNSTTLNDISGNINPGSLINGSSYSTDGSGSIDFDGTNDYISYGAVSSLSSTSFTMCFWIKPNFSLISGFGTVAGYDGNRRILIRTSDSRLLSQLSGNHFSTAGSIVNNTWQQVVYKYDNSENLEYWYINGTFNISRTPTGVTPVWNQSFYFGRYTLSTIYIYGGYISQSMFYNRALSATEVLQNYNATKTRFGL
jgi:hypothetical protein